MHCCRDWRNKRTTKSSYCLKPFGLAGGFFCNKKTKKVLELPKLAGSLYATGAVCVRESKLRLDKSNDEYDILTEINEKVTFTFLNQ